MQRVWQPIRGPSFARRDRRREKFQAARLDGRILQRPNVSFVRLPANRPSTIDEPLPALLVSSDFDKKTPGRGVERMGEPLRRPGGQKGNAMLEARVGQAHGLDSTFPAGPGSPPSGAPAFSCVQAAGSLASSRGLLLVLRAEDAPPPQAQPLRLRSLGGGSGQLQRRTLRSVPLRALPLYLLQQ